MSSLPHSPRPPGNPVRSTTPAEARGNLSRIPSVRTRVPEVATPRANEIDKGKEKETGMTAPDSEIQVPSSIPHRDTEEDHIEKDQHEPRSDQTEVTDDPLVELPPMEWEDFQRRHKEEMDKANEEEAKIIAEFDKLSAAFGSWAQAGSEKDNYRCAKRIKTQARYVQMSEDSLQDKREHYTSVVEAFEKAINMLRHPGPKR